MFKPDNNRTSCNNYIK